VVADSGEGRWTVDEAVAQGVPAPVLVLALMARFQSQGRGDYASRLVAMMRHGFGGHAVVAAAPGARASAAPASPTARPAPHA
jgi:6-phosphogluconate dehydrogenase